MPEKRREGENNKSATKISLRHVNIISFRILICDICFQIKSKDLNVTTNLDIP